ncbi:MAG: hypothetical protein MjAS7_1978 [Metallosphaera javensis (ex Sakai et al. 2022)]|nr:MAG: hypothetical protein MjAS7_1978 [Metallosphaera javensis (ex Sakai et al. 2022)]
MFQTLKGSLQTKSNQGQSERYIILFQTLKGSLQTLEGE